jgi:hypothetical protein
VRGRGAAVPIGPNNCSSSDFGDHCFGPVGGGGAEATSSRCNYPSRSVAAEKLDAATSDTLQEQRMSQRRRVWILATQPDGSRPAMIGFCSRRLPGTTLPPVFPRACPSLVHPPRTRSLVLSRSLSLHRLPSLPYIKRYRGPIHPPSSSSSPPSRRSASACTATTSRFPSGSAASWGRTAV